MQLKLQFAFVNFQGLGLKIFISSNLSSKTLKNREISKHTRVSKYVYSFNHVRCYHIGPQSRSTNIWKVTSKNQTRDFGGDIVDQNPLASAGDMGSILGPGKISHAMEQLNLCTTTTESTCASTEASVRQSLHVSTRGRWNEKPVRRDEEQPSLAETRESLQVAMNTRAAKT